MRSVSRAISLPSGLGSWAWLAAMSLWGASVPQLSCTCCCCLLCRVFTFPLNSFTAFCRYITALVSSEMLVSDDSEPGWASPKGTMKWEDDSWLAINPFSLHSCISLDYIAMLEKVTLFLCSSAFSCAIVQFLGKVIS